MYPYCLRQPHSALEHYDTFTAWENSDAQPSQHILRQLRNNLHNYEHSIKQKRNQ